MALPPLPLMAAVGMMSTLLASTFTWIWAMPMYLAVTPAGSLAMVTVALTEPLLPGFTEVTVALGGLAAERALAAPPARRSPDRPTLAGEALAAAVGAGAALAGARGAALAGARGAARTL